MKERFYDDTGGENKSFVEKEGLAKKLIRNGLIAFGISTLSKKGVKKLDNDFIKLTVGTGLALSLSQDDEVGGDLIASSTFIMAGSGMKLAKNMLKAGDFKDVGKIAKNLSRADDLFQGIAKASFNINDKVMDTFGQGFAKSASKTKKTTLEPNLVQSGIEQISNIFGGVKNVLVSPAKAVYQDFKEVKTGLKAEGLSFGFGGFVDATTNSFNRVSMNSKNAKLNLKYQMDPDSLEFLKKKAMGMKALSVESGEDGFFKTGAKKVANKIGSTFFGLSETFEINNHHTKERADIKRYLRNKNVEGFNVFENLLGRYTKTDDLGKVKVDYGTIVEEKSNFFDPLNELANQYKKSLGQETYDNSSIEDQKKGFIEYLNVNGFKGFVDKYYKNDEYISFGEFENQYKTKDIMKLDASRRGEIKRGIVNEKMFDGSYENNYIKGLKNGYLLEDFAFTNVIQKGENGALFDKTAFDGQLSALQGLGVLEQNLTAMYKNPLGKNMSSWNPLSMIDSANRIKNKIYNDTLGFGKLDNNFILDGKRIEFTKTDIIDGEEKKIGEITNYFTDNSEAYSFDFKKVSRDVKNQGLDVLNENVKTNKTMKSVFNTLLKEGFKSALEDFSSSTSNPLKARYEKGKGFRVARDDQTYNTSGSLFSMFESRDINSKEVSVDNVHMLGKAEQQMNYVLGSVVAELSNVSINDYDKRVKYSDTMAELHFKKLGMMYEEVVSDFSKKREGMDPEEAQKIKEGLIGLGDHLGYLKENNKTLATTSKALLNLQLSGKEIPDSLVQKTNKLIADKFLNAFNGEEVNEKSVGFRKLFFNEESSRIFGKHFGEDFVNSYKESVEATTRHSTNLYNETFSMEGAVNATGVGFFKVGEKAIKAEIGVMGLDNVVNHPEDFKMIRQISSYMASESNLTLTDKYFSKDYLKELGERAFTNGINEKEFNLFSNGFSDVDTEWYDKKFGKEARVFSKHFSKTDGVENPYYIDELTGEFFEEGIDSVKMDKLIVSEYPSINKTSFENFKGITEESLEEKKSFQESLDFVNEVRDAVKTTKGAIVGNINKEMLVEENFVNEYLGITKGKFVDKVVYSDGSVNNNVYHKKIKNEIDGSEEINFFYNKNDMPLTANEREGLKVERRILSTINKDIAEFENKGGIFDEAYNIALGYKFNKINNKYKETGLFEKAEPYIDYINKVGEDEEMQALYANTLAGLMSENKRFYNNSILNDVFEGETDNNYKSYKAYEKLESEMEHPDYYSAVNYYMDTNYKRVGDEFTPGVIVKSSLKRFNEERGVLNKVRIAIEEMVDSNKPWVNSSSSYDNVGKGFGKSDSAISMGIKTAYHRLQGAFEYIGVERILQEDLGDTAWQQSKTMFTKRYMPMVAMVTGAIAINSFTDAIIPDEVPIIGNGVAGVATRTYGTARVGLQYGLKATGLLGAMRYVNEAVPLFDNGLTSWFDLLMDPKEMIDVYFKGKAVRVNKNRNWFTAGRQSGEGEEFDEYRPHLLYQIGNPTAGIYSSKIEKHFRQDNLLTKYPWYILDPYKEERELYSNHGAVFPKTEQLFKDVPIIGHLMSATIGEMIKPTQYVGEANWRVGENMMKNPAYNPSNPMSPEFIEFNEPNRLLKSIFEAKSDFEQMAGLPGYMSGMLTEVMFGKNNPWDESVGLQSTDKVTTMHNAYSNLQLGGMFGITEPIRRVLDKPDSSGQVMLNPLEQKIEEWMPDYFKNGNNPYVRKSGGFYLNGDGFENTYQSTGNEEIDTFKKLSFLAPTSEKFKQMNSTIIENFDSYSEKEKKSYYESVSYADKYGKREYDTNKDTVTGVKKQEIKIDKVINNTSFISDGKRYKVDNILDFNSLSEKVGGTKAKALTDTFKLKKGDSLFFDVATEARQVVGIDSEGDFIKVGAVGLSKTMLDKDSVYYKGKNNFLTSSTRIITNRIKNSPMPSNIEKIIGKKDVLQEWSAETVQAPFFRDWDSPVASFVEPIYNYSANSFTSAIAFNSSLSDGFDASEAIFDIAGTINKAGMLKGVYNKFTGNVERSSSYEEETEVGDQLEALKYISGNKSIHTLNSRDSLKQMKKMVNETDEKFLEDLANVTNKNKRDEILKFADYKLSSVLKTIWNRQEELLNNNESNNKYIIEKNKRINVTNVGAYDGNIDRARLAIKSALNIKKSKLDSKRTGIITSYRGGLSKKEANFISDKMYSTYKKKPVTVSTIYPKGSIEINRGE